MVAREAGVARVAGASPVMAREDPVVSTAAPVALMRPRGFGGVGGGSGGVDGARLWWLRGRRRRHETTANWGDGSDVERGIWGRSGGRGKRFWVKSNSAVAPL